jgi:hypothetical protein
MAPYDSIFEPLMPKGIPEMDKGQNTGRSGRLIGYPAGSGHTTVQVSLERSI